MDLQLKGKAALVTGGSRGIGRQIALSLAEEGVRVAICARNEEQLKKTAAEIRSYGVDCIATSVDLSMAEDCQRVVHETVAAFGAIDILVNNAGANVDRKASQLQDKEDDELMERVGGKAFAAIRCSRAALSHMQDAGSGRIICIAGLSARMVPRAGARASSQSAPMVTGLGNAMITNFGKNLAEQTARDGILVNVIHPDKVRTDRHPARMAKRAEELGVTVAEAEADLAKHIPIGRAIEPTDIAPLVLLLASPINGAITGQAIAVDGGINPGINY